MNVGWGGHMIFTFLVCMHSVARIGEHMTD